MGLRLYLYLYAYIYAFGVSVRPLRQNWGPGRLRCLTAGRPVRPVSCLSAASLRRLQRRWAPRRPQLLPRRCVCHSSQGLILGPRRQQRKPLGYVGSLRGLRHVCVQAVHVAEEAVQRPVGLRRRSAKSEDAGLPAQALTELGAALQPRPKTRILHSPQGLFSRKGRQPPKAPDQRQARRCVQKALVQLLLVAEGAPGRAVRPRPRAVGAKGADLAVEAAAVAAAGLRRSLNQAEPRASSSGLRGRFLGRAPACHTRGLRPRRSRLRRFFGLSIVAETKTSPPRALRPTPRRRRSEPPCSPRQRLEPRPCKPTPLGPPPCDLWKTRPWTSAPRGQGQTQARLRRSRAPVDLLRALRVAGCSIVLHAGLSLAQLLRAAAKPRLEAKRQAPFPTLQGEDEELVEDEGVPGATAYSVQLAI